MDERPIPPAALRDDNSVELIRVWIAEHQFNCSLKIGLYQDRNIREELAWGTILADAARHIANALSEDGVESASSLLETIRTRINSEIDVPTSPVSGEFLNS